MLNYRTMLVLITFAINAHAISLFKCRSNELPDSSNEYIEISKSYHTQSKNELDKFFQNWERKSDAINAMKWNLSKRFIASNEIYRKIFTPDTISILNQFIENCKKINIKVDSVMIKMSANSEPNYKEAEYLITQEIVNFCISSDSAFDSSISKGLFEALSCKYDGKEKIISKDIQSLGKKIINGDVIYIDAVDDFLTKNLISNTCNDKDENEYHQRRNFLKQKISIANMRLSSSIYIETLPIINKIIFNNSISKARVSVTNSSNSRSMYLFELVDGKWLEKNSCKNCVY